MIISQFDTSIVSPGNLIEDYQNEMGYGFEIKAESDLEIEQNEVVIRKLIDLVGNQVLEKSTSNSL
jgi:hypothetical protein